MIIILDEYMKKRYAMLFLALVMTSSCLYAIENSKHMQRILESIKCELPAKSADFYCSSLSSHRSLYIRMKEGRVEQVGVKLFSRELKSTIDVVTAECIERVWLELLECGSLAAQKTFLKEYQVQLVLNGFPLGGNGFGSLTSADVVLDNINGVSTKFERENITVRFTTDGKDVLSVILPSSRELLFCTDKKEHEEILMSELEVWKKPFVEDELPDRNSLKVLDDGVLVQEGSAFMIDSLRSDVFYSMDGNKVKPVFSKEFPEYSYRNLLMGRISGLKVNVDLKYNSYDNMNGNIKMTLSRLLGFMQSQGMEFYSSYYMDEKGKQKCLLFMFHPKYQFVNMLVCDISESGLSADEITLKGVLYTFLPQNNIKNLFNI